MEKLSDLSLAVLDYFNKRQLKHPNVWEALGWATAELGEVYEVLFSQSGSWVRNNPEKHPVKSDEDLAEELGDVILMLIVAGLEKGVDPINAMREKMKRKLSQITGEVKVIFSEEAEEFMKQGNATTIKFNPPFTTEVNPSGGSLSIEGVYYDELEERWKVK